MSRRKLTTEQFIEKAKKIHGDKYDYSKVEYINNRTKICIICPIHGEFWQIANSHLQGEGCKECGMELKAKNKTLTTDKFIEKAKKIHGDKYDYSKVEYKSANQNVCIICPLHGEFKQKAILHLIGHGCPKCGLERSANKRKLTREEFIEKAKKIHGNKYDYSKVKYDGMLKKVKIICHVKKRNGEEHGEFLQEPHNHLKGNGCPICRHSSLERIVEEELQKNSIKFIHHADSKLFPWLKKQHLDFYLPEHNIAIECQGEQHFSKYRFEKDDEKLKIRNELDRNKNKLCKENNIKIIYYSNVPKYLSFLENKLIKNNNDLIKEIYD
jgi:hypothetical protein